MIWYSIYPIVGFLNSCTLQKNVTLAFWRNACILHDTGLEFFQATVSSIKCIVHMYILTGVKYTQYTPNL